MIKLKLWLSSLFRKPLPSGNFVLTFNEFERGTR